MFKMEIQEKVLKKVKGIGIYSLSHERYLVEKAISLTLAEVEKIIDGRIKNCKKLGTVAHLVVVANLETLKEKLKGELNESK